jgi:hypothetical protein
MANDQAPLPRRGMVISILTRRDAVIMDPARFMVAARRAFQKQNPACTDDEATLHVADVYSAVHALIDQYGSIASEHPDVAAGATERRHLSGGVGLLPGDRVHDRPDGLSPAGDVSHVSIDVPRPLQDYGCFLPDDEELFGRPGRGEVATS